MEIFTFHEILEENLKRTWRAKKIPNFEKNGGKKRKNFFFTIIDMGVVFNVFLSFKHDTDW